MNKPNKLRFLALMPLLLSVSCNVTPPDVPVCEYLTQHMSMDPVTKHLLLTPSPTCETQIGEPECGHCTYIMSGKEIYLGEGLAHLLNKKPWSAVRAESVYVPAVESFAPIETYIINSCKKMNCNNQVDAFKIKINSLNGITGAINNP